MSSSRLHETQPGALIFRGRMDATVSLRVVLLVLETPTSGVHRESLRNAIEFLAAWKARTTGHRASVEAATRSEDHRPRLLWLGGVDGARVGAHLAEDSVGQQLGTIRVVSTATADMNQQTMKQFAPDVEFSTTTRLSSQSTGALGRTLGRMNQDWQWGCHVAWLVESNTAFGSGVSTRNGKPPTEETKRTKHDEPCSKPSWWTDWWWNPENGASADTRGSRSSRFRSRFISLS